MLKRKSSCKKSKDLVLPNTNYTRLESREKKTIQFDFFFFFTTFEKDIASTVELLVLQYQKQ